MNSKYFNDLAKEKLTGNFNRAALIIFIHTIILSAINGIGSIFTKEYYFVQTIFTILSVILAGPFALGLVKVFEAFHNNEDVEISVLFSGFKENFGKSIGLYIVQSIFIILWTCLLIIPGIIMSYAYRLTFYILNDNKDINIIDAIKESKNIMRGNKLRLFWLDLSYIGWFLLSILTLGILLFWVTAKHEMAVYEFYYDLTKKTDEQIEGDMQNNDKSLDNPFSGDYVL